MQSSEHSERGNARAYYYTHHFAYMYSEFSTLYSAFDVQWRILENVGIFARHRLLALARCRCFILFYCDDLKMLGVVCQE